MAPKANLRLITFNTQLLTIGGGGAQEAARIGEVLAAQAYDIVCLQEVFSEKARKALVAELKGTYPAILDKHGAGGLFDDSGLLFASTLPVTSHEFIKFPCAMPTITFDFLARKGVLGVELKWGDGQPLWVFNSHLEATSKGTRTVQLRVIRDFIDSAIKRSPGTPPAVLLGGDLNVRGETPGAPEYSAMLQTLDDPRDLFRECFPDVPGETYSSTHPRRRLDYWFAWDAFARDALAKIEVKSIKLAPFQGEARTLSDHFPIELTIEV